jgi:hypothetical protein
MALEMKSKLYEEFKKVVPPGISADAALAKFNEYFGENNVAAQTKKDLMAVNRNQVVIDPNTGKTVFDNTQDPTQFGQVEYMTLKNGKEIAFVRDENGKPQVIGQDAPRVSVSVGGGAGDKTDQIVARAAVADLPKLRRDARSAEQVKPRIDQMVKLLDSGAGGIKGNSLAAISGIFDTPATSEAELFKKLASAGAGQLRASVIGPGPVSNYEQSLLQSVSGGGNGARTAIRALLKYYASEAQKTIDNYNDAVDSATTVAPKAERGFGKIGQGRPQPPAGRKSTSDPMGIR